MRRRDLIAAGTAVALSAPVIAATPALASAPKKEEGAEPADKTVSIRAVGLPVIVEGRIRNYVFVNLKLHLAPEPKVEDIQNKEAFFRDALVRTGHGAPFTLPDDWNKLSDNKINAALMAIAEVVVPHAIIKAEVTNQIPRRRVSGPVIETVPDPYLTPDGSDGSADGVASTL
ncbi:hypothetical protein [Brevundimonas goettingensis]|uniref:Tat pathway signal sequence domain protein n=1 Tax=Brevundimonas goettingensis TaxID=2774190 RepID=A0A975C2Z3_9CAUL|nr:hypothetical protein [Brevundimonas goettingensis]QTC92908.1 hypothetical protein IFJ75_08720 [Brevundimonas goettingensis]